MPSLAEHLRADVAADQLGLVGEVPPRTRSTVAGCSAASTRFRSTSRSPGTPIDQQLGGSAPGWRT